MKTVRNLLLSVLLSAFGFFVVHDYVITDVDADTQYEVVVTQKSISALDLPSQIHEHIHILLSVPENAASLSENTLDGAPLQTYPETASSYITSIRPRPPLS